MKNWLFTLFLNLCLLATPSHSQFFEEGRFVRDVRNNITWYRCTLGQVWNNDTETCSGETVRLSQDEIIIAVQQAEQQLGGQWRLPTKDELESLICVECDPPKIRQKYFRLILGGSHSRQIKLSSSSLVGKRHWPPNCCSACCTAIIISS